MEVSIGNFEGSTFILPPPEENYVQARAGRSPSELFAQILVDDDGYVRLHPDTIAQLNRIEEKLDKLLARDNIT